MLRDWLKLARFSNSAVAGVGVILGHACLPGPMDYGAAALGALALGLLASAGNMQNDALDAEADRINQPARPIPAGRITRGQALRMSAFLYVVSILLSGWLGISLAGGAFPGLHPALSATGELTGPRLTTGDFAPMALTAGMALLLVLYNLKLKALPLWGNLAVALLCALAVYFPEFPHAPLHTGLPALFAFLTTAAREVSKDAEDVPGDRAVGWSTFPIRFGDRAAKAAVGILSACVLVLLPLPYLLLDYHPGYFLLILLGPLPALIAVLRGLTPPATDWGRVQRRLKWVMVSGMAAIFVGVTVGVR